MLNMARRALRTVQTAAARNDVCVQPEQPMPAAGRKGGLIGNCATGDA